jgi:hypothetical protein
VCASMVVAAVGGSNVKLCMENEVDDDEFEARREEDDGDDDDDDDDATAATTAPRLVMTAVSSRLRSRVGKVVVSFSFGNALLLLLDAVVVVVVVVAAVGGSILIQ